jgi:excisionase family DNA binding protein
VTTIPDIAVADEPLPAMFSVKSLAAYLALSERTVRDLLSQGELPSYKVAGARRIARSDVESWLHTRREGGQDG